MTPYELLTEGQRLEAVLPVLWERAQDLDDTAQFSDLQLGSIVYTTALKAASKWSPEGLPFDNYCLLKLDQNMERALREKSFTHPAELMLARILNATQTVGA